MTEANKQQWTELIRFNEQGFVPAIIQDAASKEVLMLGYMNEESLHKTIESGETWFWSRSRKKLWHKGATSGNIQKVTDIAYDCDQDTLLVKVVPAGPACHTGRYRCFQSAGTQGLQASSHLVNGDPSLAAKENGLLTSFGRQDGGRFTILSDLESVIASREAERPEGAYTTYLFEKGLDKILKKVGEETAEVIIAAKNQDKDELRYETADLIFHLLVLLRELKLPLDDVMDELEKRHTCVPK
jgi:phosphoribosyl-AMP cyclohydrolase / phosphoribosyl-ATP pyrophosphohydrolase